VKLTMTHDFDHPIDTVWAMFSDPAAHVAKFEAMGHREIEVLEEESSDERLRMVIRRITDLDLPAIAAKVIPASPTVVTDDVWEDRGDGTYGGHFDVEMEGVPQRTRGTTLLTPNDDDTTHYTVALDISVKVPLIGDRIAKAGRGQLEEQLGAEFAAGDAWLAAHA